MLRRQTIRLIPKKHVDVLTSSTANWTWPAVREIAEVKHVPLFGLTPVPLNLTQRALCELNIKQHILSDMHVDPTQHVDIPGTMAKLGIKELSPSEVRNMSDAEMEQYLALVDAHENVRLNLERFMVKLYRGLRAERCKITKSQRDAVSQGSQGRKVLDTFAWTIATICGFDETPLLLTATGLDDLENGHEMRLFNEPVAVTPDLYVVRKSHESHPEKGLIMLEADSDDFLPHRNNTSLRLSVTASIFITKT